MTGKRVQLPWGKATVEEEATIPADGGERPIESFPDLLVLGVRQPEGTMERLLGRLCHAFT